MLSYFPTPYPDELLYSIITRYHIRSGNLNFNQTLLELLGYSPQQLFNVDLPNNLEYLVKRLPTALTHHLETFIQDHTLYPFYRSFLKAPEAWMLKKRMQKKLGSSISAIAKIHLPVQDGSRGFLRYCPVCLKQNIEQYGEAYWHRMHQVPGVLICTTHYVMLHKSLIPIQEGYLSCYPADLINCSIEVEPQVYSEDTMQNLMAIAKEISWLCNAQFEFKGLQWLRKQYQHHLVDQSFVSFSSSSTFKFHEEKFVDAVLSCYGQDCLSLIKPSLADRLGRYFYRCLFACDVEPVIDRVTHILLIKFLLKSLKNLLEA